MREHRSALEAAGAETREVRRPAHLEGLEGLVIPGGESTAIGKLLDHAGLFDAIKGAAREGMAVFGTCAGLILLAREIEGSSQPRLGLMDVTAHRNAFGRQRESFEADLVVAPLGPEPVHAVFIRAPYIVRTGPGVEVLASYDGKVVMARQDRCLSAAFHPELTGDLRVHRYFLEEVLGG